MAEGSLHMANPGSVKTAADLEEDGNFQWQIEGRADVQGEAGGCPDIPEGKDWYGTETLTVVESENDGVPVDCVYEMEVSGTYKGSGGEE